MSDELKCPACGRKMLFFVFSEWVGYVSYKTIFECRKCEYSINTPNRKTKRGAINAARRLLEKMKGGE